MRQQFLPKERNYCMLMFNSMVAENEHKFLLETLVNILKSLVSSSRLH